MKARRRAATGRHMHKCRIAAALVGALLLATPLHAQVATGSILGK